MRRHAPAIVLLAMAASTCLAEPAKEQPATTFVIEPYRYRAMWVFDDAEREVVREPFVRGVPEMIDILIKDIPDAKENGFRLMFSAEPFDGHAMHLDWRRAERGGNWYHNAQFDKEGWLCPVLYKYFEEAPKRIYVKAEPRSD